MIIFVDLKLNDTVNTMTSAVKALKDMKINYLTVHISSGFAALKAVKKISGQTKIIGVTTLTSLNNKDLKLIGYNKSVTNLVTHQAKLAKKANLDACAINPVLVLGPSMTGVLSMSNRVTVKKIFSLPFIPDLSISVVGVQDVAEAHVMAMENDDAIGNRFLLSCWKSRS